MKFEKNNKIVKKKCKKTKEDRKIQKHHFKQN